MLKKQFTLETVTFRDNTGYDYPVLSGYGKGVEVSLMYHHAQDKQNSVTVKIGDYCLVPNQIDEIIKEISVYRKAIEAEGAEPYKEEKEVIVNSNNYGERKLSDLKNDVIAAKENYGYSALCFSVDTVETLINKIEELSK